MVRRMSREAKNKIKYIEENIERIPFDMLLKMYLEIKKGKR